MTRESATLAVTGVHTLFKPDPRVARIVELRRQLRDKSRKNREPSTRNVTESSSGDPKEPIRVQENWETDSAASEWSDASHRPPIWVDIKAKAINEPECEVPFSAPVTSVLHPPTASIPPASSSRERGKKILVRPTGLPILFQNFIDKSYAMIAEVEAAKERSSKNQIISKEDNINWTSEAPRPLALQLSKKTAKHSAHRNNLSVKRRPKNVVNPVIELYQAVRIVRIEKTKRPSLKPKEKRKNISKKSNKKKVNKHCTAPKAVSSLNPCRKTVTFQLPQQPVHRIKKNRSRRKLRGKMKRKAAKRAKKATAGRSASKTKTHRKPSPVAHDRENKPARTHTAEDAEVVEEQNAAPEKELSESLNLLKIEAAQEDCIQISRPVKNEDRLTVEPLGTAEENSETITHPPATRETPQFDDILKSLKAEKELFNLTNEEARRLEETSWLNFPRAGDTFGTRCELPFDLRLLKNMTPLEYLSRYTVPTRCRKRLNDTVFERHASSSLPIEELIPALSEILGFRMDQQSEEQLMTLSSLSAEVKELNRQEFVGLGTLAERICRRGISRRDDLEVADFTLFDEKLKTNDISEALRQLIFFISST